jgi:hypothetical protein
MGFDTTRTVDLALHSYGHYLEGLFGNLLTVELFWYRYGGNNAAGFPRSVRCGNVHFPPNANIDYQYNSGQNVQNNFCDDWNPTGSGQTQTVACNKWGCDEKGYMVWWMQRMPGYANTLTYQDKKMPSWWDFVGEMDDRIEYYRNNSDFFFNHGFIP